MAASATTLEEQELPLHLPLHWRNRRRPLPLHLPLHWTKLLTGLCHYIGEAGLPLHWTARKWPLPLHLPLHWRNQIRSLPLHQPLHWPASATTSATTLEESDTGVATTSATTLQEPATAHSPLITTSFPARDQGIVAPQPGVTKREPANGQPPKPPGIPPASFIFAPPTAEWLKQWRIEINRRRHKESGGFTYHWNYRITLSDGQRTAMYGGTLAVLIGLNKERWNEYQDRSAEHARRRRQK
jgi:hypothetical protein